MLKNFVKIKLFNFEIIKKKIILLKVQLVLI